MEDKGMIEVEGIWLRTDGDKLRVLVQVGGTWRIAIEHRPWLEEEDGTISHIAEPCGIKVWPHDPVTKNEPGK